MLNGKLIGTNLQVSVKNSYFLADAFSASGYASLFFFCLLYESYKDVLGFCLFIHWPTKSHIRLEYRLN